jgi:5-methylcytosine-specific restriction endonuclease McrA
MQKSCARCGDPFDARGRARFCPSCRPSHDREQKRAAATREYANNRERALARQARFRERHREEIRARARAYHARPERQAYSARKHSEQRFGGLREAVLARDDYRCQSCGKPWQEGSRSIVVHHLDEDKSHNTMENLLTLCRSCHPKRHPHSEEHRARLSAMLRGRPKVSHGPLSPEHRARISAANRGRRQSPETIERMREAKRRWWATQPPERRSEIARKRRAHSS